jgi:hypothetical protein
MTKANYQEEISWIAYEVDFVPSPIDHYKAWPEPYRSAALRAFEYRKTMFNALADERLSEWE